MKKREKISDAVTRRLPRYYHALKAMQNKGIHRVSSTMIAATLNVTASQVRQDFSCFGEFGQQGYGYDVANLKSQIAAVLGLSERYDVIVVGGGKIGTALARYTGFREEGFDIRAIFDVAPDSVAADGIPVYGAEELEGYLAENRTDIVIIATDAGAAESVAKHVREAGVTAIWNFAPVELYLGEDVAVENINMTDSLFMLSYQYKNLRERGEK